MTVLGPNDPRAVRKPLPSKIEELQQLYDWLTRRRASAISLYDHAPDGSPEKREARRRLDSLGDYILAVEKRIGEVLS